MSRRMPELRPQRGVARETAVACVWLALAMATGGLGAMYYRELRLEAEREITLGQCRELDGLERSCCLAAVRGRYVAP